MNPTFESEIIEIGVYHQYLDAIKPSTHSYLLPLHKNDIREEIAQLSPNGQKVISLYLQCQDLKGTRRDLLFNTETVYQLILLIKNIDTPISLDNKNIYIYESAFTACIVNFVAFFLIQKCIKNLILKIYFWLKN